jgi:hypothetical protein
MQDQPSRLRAEHCRNEAQFLILALLLERGGPPQWTLDELAREMGCEIDALEAVQRLSGAGLAHRTGDGFVFASRPAHRFCELLRG